MLWLVRRRASSVSRFKRAWYSFSFCSYRAAFPPVLHEIVHRYRLSDRKEWYSSGSSIFPLRAASSWWREKTDYAIPGLSFCGGHYIRGDGYSCAYIMGETIGKRVAKRIKGGA